MGHRIREDFDGVALATGQFGAVQLRAGDVIPEGVSVAASLTDDGQAVWAPEEPSPFSGAGWDDAAPLSSDEQRLALAHGADVTRPPLYLRGYLDAVAEHTDASGDPGSTHPSDLPPGPEADALSDFLNTAYDQLLASPGHAVLTLPDGTELVYDANAVDLTPGEPRTPGQTLDGDTEDMRAEADAITAELFDPSEHSAHDVIAYLTAHVEDRERVIAAEHAGQGRRSILTRYPSLDPGRQASSDGEG